MTFEDIWDQNEENLIFLILLFWGKNLKIGKFSFVDIFQKLWIFAAISACPSERGVFSLSFATKFEYLRRPCRSGEQIDQETIFEFILPAGVKKNCYPQGLIWWTVICINRFCSMPISRFTIFTFACLTISVYFAALEKNEDMNGHKMILTFSVQNLLSFPINVFLFFWQNALTVKISFLSI